MFDAVFGETKKVRELTFAFSMFVKIIQGRGLSDALSCEKIKIFATPIINKSQFNRIFANLKII